MSESTSYAIVGGGIIGLAIAHQLIKRCPDAKVSLFEKEPEVGKHQSGHNSGVLHAGLYYKPGSLKAKLAVTGIRQMRAFCERHNIAHDVCGKLVVACSQEEIPRLRDLYDRGQRNGLRGLEWLNPDQMREIEPHVAGVAAVRVPEEGIADYPAVCRTLQQLIVAGGGEVLTGAAVTELRRARDSWEVNGREMKFLINTAGLHCDRVLALSGLKRTTRIVPFRGEYYQLNEEGRQLVKNLIYPVPDPRFPFLGVHFTRMIHGGVEAGPNAVLATAREGYRYSDFSLRDVVDTFTYGGFWRFMARYPSMTFFELKRSLSRSEFCRSLQRLVPALEERHLAPGGAGVRAQALAPDGTLLQDFEIVRTENALHLINAPSPGATASLAIADYLIDRIVEDQTLVGASRSGAVAPGAAVA
jgi:L-2-hydroxyglutarate oxidase LhgO